MTVELASLVANTGALAALGADKLNVGDVDRHLLVDDAALLTGSAGLDGLLGDGDALDDDLALGRTTPCLPRSLPESTSTLSPFLMDIDIVVSPLR